MHIWAMGSGITWIIWCENGRVERFFKARLPG